MQQIETDLFQKSDIEALSLFSGNIVQAPVLVELANSTCAAFLSKVLNV